MIATLFASHTDLSTIQVNLADSEEVKKDLLKGGDKLLNMVEEMGWPDGQFAGSITAATGKPQVRRGSWVVAKPGSGFIIISFGIVTNQFVAKACLIGLAPAKIWRKLLRETRKLVWSGAGSILSLVLGSLLWAGTWGRKANVTRCPWDSTN